MKTEFTFTTMCVSMRIQSGTSHFANTHPFYLQFQEIFLHSKLLNHSPNEHSHYFLQLKKYINLLEGQWTPILWNTFENVLIWTELAVIIWINSQNLQNYGIERPLTLGIWILIQILQRALWVLTKDDAGIQEKGIGRQNSTQQQQHKALTAILQHKQTLL